jgi:hypothetical protein
MTASGRHASLCAHLCVAHERKFTMKRIALAALLLLTVVCPTTQTTAPPAEAAAANLADPQRNEVTVYVTDTGTKYHRAGCVHLRRSSHSLSLSEAKRRGYEPCKVCKPAR